MVVDMPKRAHGGITLLFIVLNFWRVIPSKNNLDSAKRAPTTDLKNNIALLKLNYFDFMFFSIVCSSFKVFKCVKQKLEDPKK